MLFPFRDSLRCVSRNQAFPRGSQTLILYLTRRYLREAVTNRDSQHVIFSQTLRNEHRRMKVNTWLYIYIYYSCKLCAYNSFSLHSSRPRFATNLLRVRDINIYVYISVCVYII